MLSYIVRSLEKGVLADAAARPRISAMMRNRAGARRSGESLDVTVQRWISIMTRPHATPRLPAALVLCILAFSALTVYAMAMALYTADVETGAANATQSLNQYHQALEGWRGRPYQWRLLGIYLVRAGERMSGASPHAVDVGVNTVLPAG